MQTPSQTPRDRLRRPVAPVAPNPAPTPESLSAEVESLLDAMRASQDSLLAAVREHREAIATADERAIQAGLDRHRLAFDEVRQVELRRAALATRLGGRPAARASFSQLLARVPGSDRERLTTLAAGVRELAITAQREQRALGEASLALAGHMEGLIRGVSARVSEAGTYGRRGYVESGARPVGVLDISR